MKFQSKNTLKIQELKLNLVCPHCKNIHQLYTDQGSDTVYTVCSSCGITFESKWSLQLEIKHIKMVYEQGCQLSSYTKIETIDYIENERDD